MQNFSIRQEILGLAPYVPGLSIAEIKAKYGLDRVIKLASNENPLGTSPLVQEALHRHAAEAFRYPQSGNPNLVNAIANYYNIPKEEIIIGNGSDEILDLLIRMLARPSLDNIVCFQPCFSLYPIQAQINAVEVRRQKLEADFSFNFDALLNLVDAKTRLVFITTPDNPTGYCPEPQLVLNFAQKLVAKAPQVLLVIDEAYMDFAGETCTLANYSDSGASYSLFSQLAQKDKANLVIPAELAKNLAFIRTFSKSFGLAGLRIGYARVAKDLAECYWRTRLPFSLNILAEYAGIAALSDLAFRKASLECVRTGRAWLSQNLAKDFIVYPSQANFILVKPKTKISAQTYYEKLLEQGIILRKLQSYDLPDYLRISIGTAEENHLCLEALRKVTQQYS